LRWRTNYFGLAYIKVDVITGTVNRNLDRDPDFRRKALDTWQRTEILLHALHHLK
jgi:hypothetical protein